MPGLSELAVANAILNANRGKSFVQRILYPENYPVIENDDGTVSTHRMATVEQNGKTYVFPTILLESDGTLKQYDPRTAFDFARKSGNLIAFDDPMLADWFARGGYKLGMGNPQ